MQYDDFELEVGPGAEGGYTVSVVRSPAGEAQSTARFPYDGLALENRLKSLQIALLRGGGTHRSGAAASAADDRAVRELGRDLFRTLFPPEIASRLAVSRSIARRRNRGVRIKLRIEAPELLGLPWEYIYDDEHGDYLALASGTPLVRYLPVSQPIPPLKVSPPLRILAMAAGPTDMERLDVEQERARLDIALADLKSDGLVELDWVRGETWEHLQQALWRGPWHIFHFVGHGGFSERLGTGLLYLTGEDGKARELPAGDLARLLGDHDALRLAVLNSCDTAEGTDADIFSSTAAALVRRGTPAVVAMQFQITDRAAIQFSRSFYAAMAAGMPIDTAVTEARKAVALKLRNTFEWGTPVLFMRSADGVLFRVPKAVREAAEAVARRSSVADAVLPSSERTSLKDAIAEAGSAEVAIAQAPDVRPGGPAPPQPRPAAVEERPRPPLKQPFAQPRSPVRAHGATRIREQGRIVHAAGVRVLAFSPDGRYLASGGDQKTVVLSDVERGVPLSELIHGLFTYVRAVSFSPSGETLATGCDDFAVTLWPVGHALPARLDARQPDAGTAFLDHKGIRGLAFSPDGATLATGGGKVVRLWDVRAAAPAGSFSLEAEVKRVAFDPAGTRLVAGAENGTVRVWQLATGSTLSTMTWQSIIAAGCAGLAFSPEGRWVAAAPEYNRAAKVWDPDSGALRYELTHPTLFMFGSVLSIAFSPDGSRIATACGASRAYIWDAESGRQLAELAHTSGQVNSVAFSPDGELVATAGDDRTGRIWNVADGRQLAQMNHEAGVKAVAFSPGGDVVATGSDDRTLRIWELERAG